jgi:hypothetical protein
MSNYRPFHDASKSETARRDETIGLERVKSGGLAAGGGYEGGSF